MTLRLYALVIGLVVAAPIPPALRTAAAQTPAVDPAAIDTLFAEWDTPETPGAALAVIREGQVVYTKGYGMANLDYDIPITPSTVFDIASVSKQFGAMAIAMLVHEGKLSLDDDIRTHLPEVPDFGTPITIRHLVHHTSGLRDWPGALAIGGWRMDDVISFDQILHMVRRQRDLNFDPGAEYLYSNTGYNLLAETVRRVTGQSFREWTTEHIFEPLGMRHSLFHDDHRLIVKNRAQAYTSTDEGLRSVPNGLTALASSSLFTTVEDLTKWVLNFETGTVGGPEVLALMHEQGVLNDGEQIAYAFGNSAGTYRGLKTVAHSGSWAGFTSYLVRFPEERLAIVVLCNTNTLGPSQRAYEVADLYLKDRFTDDASDSEAEPPAAVSVDAAHLDAAVGTYRLGPGWYVTITKENGGLMTRATNEPTFAMTPVSDTKFWVDAYGAHIEFKGTDTGRATHFDYRDLTAPRVEAPVSGADALAAYAGSYYSDELETTYTAFVEDGMLMLDHIRHGRIALTPVAADTFTGDVWFMGEVTFTRNEAGAATGFDVYNGRNRKVHLRKL